MANMHQFLKAMIEKGASDLHITTGTPPQLRIDGKLHPLKMPPLSATRDQAALLLAADGRAEAPVRGAQRARPLVQRAEALTLPRQRLRPARQRRRGVPRDPVQDQDLRGAGPAQDRRGALAQKPRGLVLVTGPTGSGKSTTLATILDKINQERNEHIVTIEDPIEYLHQHKGCVINQREVGADTNSFKNALKYILRQDPDVVLIGEMRDLETIEAALTVAETGHLAFATLHTNSCVQTINRIVDVFPPYQQAQVRAQLSFVLEGVLCQALLPRANGPGRAMSLEVMIPNPAIRNLIREDKIHQIYSAMQVGQEKFGMQTMNQSLASLFQKRMISLETAMARSSDHEELRSMIGQGPARPTTVRRAV